MKVHSNLGMDFGDKGGSSSVSRRAEAAPRVSLGRDGLGVLEGLRDDFEDEKLDLM